MLVVLGTRCLSLAAELLQTAVEPRAAVTAAGRKPRSTAAATAAASKPANALQAALAEMSQLQNSLRLGLMWCQLLLRNQRMASVAAAAEAAGASCSVAALSRQVLALQVLPAGLRQVPEDRLAQLHSHCTKLETYLTTVLAECVQHVRNAASEAASASSSSSSSGGGGSGSGSNAGGQVKPRQTNNKKAKKHTKPAAAAVFPAATVHIVQKLSAALESVADEVSARFLWAGAATPLTAPT
jgi:uncharacterized membrane protein YgcG